MNKSNVEHGPPVSSTSVNLEDEIGITPRMVEAGALQLMEFDSKFSSFEDGALSIYRVMLRARNATPSERRLLSRERQGNPDLIGRIHNCLGIEMWKRIFLPAK